MCNGVPAYPIEPVRKIAPCSERLAQTYGLKRNPGGPRNIMSRERKRIVVNHECDRRETFDLQPHLVGELLEVRPLRPEDLKALFAVASDPLIWEQHPARDRYKVDVFKNFFRESLESRGALVVIDRQLQEIIGSSRYFGYDPERREVEIGWTFLARSHWGGRYNAELKRLMLDHAFKFVKRVHFLISSTNLRSRRAMEKLGGFLTDRRGFTNLNGKPVEHLVYQIKKPAT